MVRSSFAALDKWTLFKVIAALICVLICIYQVSAGIKMIINNSEASNIPKVDTAGLETLRDGEEIRGSIDNVIMTYDGATVLNTNLSVVYYLVRTKNDKMITLRAEQGSSMDYMLYHLLIGEYSSVEFRGVVKSMKDNTHGALNLELIASQAMGRSGIKGSIKDHLITQVIDVTTADDLIPMKYIVFTFIGGALMLVIAGLLMRKTVRDAIISNKDRKGTLEYDPKVKLEDLIFENVEFYKGNDEHGEEFFVNTEYNIYDPKRRRELEIEKKGLSPDDPDTDDATDKTGAEEKKTPPEPPVEDYYESKINDQGNFYVESDLNSTDRQPGSTYSRRY